MKIKPDSNKHDHKWTDLLKVGLFSILMSAPLMAVGIKCAYAICNKNAYMSYSGKDTPTEYVNTKNVELGEDYRIQPYTEEIRPSATIYIDFVNKGAFIESGYMSQFANVDRLALRTDGKYVFYADNVYQFELTYAEGMWNIDIELTGLKPYNTATIETCKKLFYNVNPESTKYLDNVFTYAVNDISNNSLFNWTQNTAIYTGVNAMTTNLDIVNPTIAILITYWTLLTIIYVIIDILLTGFIYLTHLIVKSN